MKRTLLLLLTCLLCFSLVFSFVACNDSGAAPSAGNENNEDDETNDNNDENNENKNDDTPTSTVSLKSYALYGGDGVLFPLHDEYNRVQGFSYVKASDFNEIGFKIILNYDDDDKAVSATMWQEGGSTVTLPFEFDGGLSAAGWTLYASLTYHENGAVKTINAPNGIGIVFSENGYVESFSVLNDVSFLYEYTDTEVWVTEVFSYSSRYDVEQRNDPQTGALLYANSVSKKDETDTRTYDWTYADGALTSYSKRDGTDVVYTANFTYDAKGNRATCRVVEIEEFYDVVKNMTYTFDTADRLIGETLEERYSDGSYAKAFTTHEYDSEGRRSRTVSKSYDESGEFVGGMIVEYDYSLYETGECESEIFSCDENGNKIN